MHDRNISARHAVLQVITDGWRSPGDACGGPWRLTTYGSDHWRLLYSLPDYAKPWNTLSEDDIRSEYEWDSDPYKEYVKHMSRRYEGEVVLAWIEWRKSWQALPRDKVLWNPQYAVSTKSAHEISLLPRGDGPCFDETVDLLAVGNTTILRTKQGTAGHWYLRGGAITLCELFAKFGDNFTASELMFWYHNAPKIVKKRPHSWGSAEHRNAAHARHYAWGRYGHCDWRERRVAKDGLDFDAANPWERKDARSGNLPPPGPA
jgi:hypothetical protein